MLKGSILALITPFEGDSLILDTYIKLINYHLKTYSKISPFLNKKQKKWLARLI